MQDIEAYTVVTHSVVFQGDLEVKINQFSDEIMRKVKDGWQPFGGVSIRLDRYDLTNQLLTAAQAMVKYVDRRTLAMSRTELETLINTQIKKAFQELQESQRKKKTIPAY